MDRSDTYTCMYMYHAQIATVLFPCLIIATAGVHLVIAAALGRFTASAAGGAGAAAASASSAWVSGAALIALLPYTYAGVTQAVLESGFKSRASTAEPLVAPVFEVLRLALLARGRVLAKLLLVQAGVCAEQAAAAASAMPVEGSASVLQGAARAVLEFVSLDVAEGRLLFVAMRLLQIAVIFNLATHVRLLPAFLNPSTFIARGLVSARGPGAVDSDVGGGPQPETEKRSAEGVDI